MRQKIQWGYLLVLTLVVSAGCATLPQVVSRETPSLDGTGMPWALTYLFTNDSRQFIHSIELTLPGDHSAMFMGVLNIHPRNRAVHCVIMTLEGLILFDAENTGDNLVIHRAVPPFDSQAFARGLISDIELIFFRPKIPLAESGSLEDHSKILRFSESNGGTTDIIVSQDRNLWSLTQRSCTHQVRRHIRYMFQSLPEDPILPVFPTSITLTATFPSRYTLTMTLIETRLIP